MTENGTLALRAEQIRNSVGYCGLVCIMCRTDGSCDCRTNNKCGKRLSLTGCKSFKCCESKGYAGCWECHRAPCGEDLMDPTNIKLRAFVRFIRDEGLDAFALAMAANEANNVVYLRNSVFGDYDLAMESDVIKLLHKGLEAAKKEA